MEEYGNVKYLWIGLGGFLGANARFLVQQWAAARWGADFPYGTMIANVSGSFIIALFLTLITERFLVSPEFRLFVAVGFLGGFTTFSSFSFETFTLLRGSGWWAASLNFLGNTVLGMIGVILGVVVAQLIQRPIYGG
ncbi:MAG: fluoride efflux transporter CrcB [Anaerolineae bacterium]|nr:fluoride efflux transporter CrcB [Anaerolineae bacterium]